MEDDAKWSNKKCGKSKNTGANVFDYDVYCHHIDILNGKREAISDRLELI